MATDTDSDAISLTSTALSEQKDEYPVEAILAEKEVDGKHPRFLVMWEGYSDVRATWEPATSFDDESTFLEWEAKKRRQSQGLEPAFDLEDWQARVDAIEREKLKRKARRKAMRKRLGIPTSPDEGEGRDGDDDKAPAPTTNVRTSGRRNTSTEDDDDESQSSVGELSRDKNDRKRRRHSDQNSDQSDGGLTSDDSLLEDIKVQEFNKKHKRLRKKKRTRGSTSSPDPVTPSQPQVATAVQSKPLSRQTSVPAIQNKPPSRQTSVTAAQSKPPSRQTSATAAQSKPPSRQASVTDAAKPVKGRATARRAANAPATKAVSNVLANWTKEPPKRNVMKPDYNNPPRPPIQNPQLFNKSSTLRRFEKAGRNERPPQEGALQLFKPGEWNPRPMNKTQASDPGLPHDKTGAGIPGDGDLESGERNEVGGWWNEEDPRLVQSGSGIAAPGASQRRPLYKRPSIARPRRPQQASLPTSSGTVTQAPSAKSQQFSDTNAAQKPAVKKLSLSEYNQRRLPGAGKKSPEGGIQPSVEGVKENKGLSSEEILRAHETIEAAARLSEPQTGPSVPAEVAHLPSISVSAKIGTSGIELGQMKLSGKMSSALQAKWTDFRILWLKQMISAEHFTKTWDLNKGKVLGEGDIEGSSEELLDLLRFYSGAGVMDVSTFVLIIYPANIEAWQYMKRVESTTTNQLKWIALPPNIGSENPIRSVGYLIDSTSMVELIYAHFFGIIYSGFLPPSTNLQSGKEPKLQVFIMADTPAGWNELVIIYQLLKVYGVAVFWSEQEGAWDYFSQRVSYGILFVNNNYRRRGIASIPRLASVLSKTINIFEFGRKYNVNEMLMMDPQNSNLILRWFRKRITDSKASTWKLILRRGDVETWLLKTITLKADTNKEDITTQNARNNVYQIISSLMYIPPGTERGSSTSFNVQQVAGEDTLEPNDPILQVANLAIWAEVNCTTYRRFITISPKPILNADTFQVVEVMTAEQFLRKYGR
ncbi:MAG: hypothetical protein M1840_000061 [Geoglossum simile]|nr:MAG: hypothetical protein M1840_000061 [Geoglossum simile]